MAKAKILELKQGINILAFFTNFLRYILVEAKLYSRTFWASVLNVSQPAITQWIQGKTTPLPKQLNNILRMLNDFKNPSDELTTSISEFYKVLDLSLSKKERKRFKNQSTIGNYILLPQKENLDNSIDKLPFHLKNEVLLFSTRLCNKMLIQLSNTEKSQSDFLSVISSLETHFDSLLNDHQETSHLEKIADQPHSLNPIDSALKEYTTLILIKSSLSDPELRNDIINSSKYLLPLDMHLFNTEESREEFHFYKNVLDHLNNPVSENINETFEKFSLSFKRHEITYLNPGLLLSLMQYIIFSRLKNSAVPFSEWDKFRKSFIKLYKEGFNQKTIKPNKISGAAFKQIIELALSYNELDFANNYIDSTKNNIVGSNKIFIQKYCNINRLLFLSKYSEASDELSKTRKPIELQHELDYNFLKLRVYWISENEPKLKKCLNALDEQLSLTLPHSSELYQKQSARFSWYKSLIELDSKNKIKSYLREDTNRTDRFALDVIDDHHWVKHVIR